MATKRAILDDVLQKDIESRDLPGKEPEKVERATRSDLVDSLETFSIRLPMSQKEALQAHFKQDLGLDMSSGIRMILTKYMRDKRV
jgi:hypothetical protein